MRAPERAEGFFARVFRLRRRIFALYLPWPILLIPLAVTVDRNFVEAILQPLERQQQDLLASGAQVISRSLISLRRDVRLIARSPALASTLSGQDTSELAQSFARFATATEYYDQVRWIDGNGQERARVDYRGGAARIVPAAELQNKSERPYYYKTVTLAPDQIYLSPLDLNIEHDRIELPHRPMLRIATSLSDAAGGRAGVLVLNYQAGILLDRLWELPGASGMEVHLFNEDGYWLFAPDPSRVWGFMLGHPEFTLARAKPALWQAMLMQQARWQDGAGSWAFRRISPVAEIMGRDPSSERAQRHWYLAINRPLAAFHAQENRIATLIAAITAAALLASLWLAVRIAFYADDRERNLAELRKQREELAHSNRALQDSLDTLRAMQTDLLRAEKLSSLGLMVAGVAHELNTPLGSALVNLSTLQQRLATLAEQLKEGLKRSTLESFMNDGGAVLKLSEDALRRAAELVRRFKQLAVDRSTMERRRFALGEVVEDSLHLWLNKRDPHGPRIVLSIPAGLELDSYPGPLGQIVSNLVGNAIQHAFAGPAPGNIAVSAHASGERVVLEVSDDGRGMDADTAAQAFDLFFTTRRSQGGTGLGLYLAHQLAHEALGGSLKLETSPGEGCCFILDIPVSAPPQPAK